MAVPARRTSKAKKNKRRTHYKVTAPSVNFDEATGDYSRSHRVSPVSYTHLDVYKRQIDNLRHQTTNVHRVS